MRGEEIGAAESKRLVDLLEIGKILGAGSGLKVALTRALERLDGSLGSVSCVVALLDEASQEVVVQAASGMSWEQIRGASYRVGEGITGRVVQSGRPVVVPRVSREPLFLNKTGAFGGKAELSYICVPVSLDGKAVGALGIAFPYHKDRSYDAEVKFFSLAAALVAQSLRVERLVEAERQRLGQENKELRQELS